MLKFILALVIMVLIPTASLAGKDVQSGPLDSLKCYWQMHHWYYFQRGNYSNGVTWIFDSKYWNDNQSSRVTARNVADPKRYITQTCDNGKYTVEQGW